MAYETYTPMYSEIFTKIHNAKDKATKIKVLHTASKDVDAYFEGGTGIFDNQTTHFGSNRIEEIKSELVINKMENLIS